jgi:SAM-dependent methyltransferase
MGKESAATAHDTSGGFGSMREAYETVGAAGYYDSHGSDYRNPHEKVLLEALALGLSGLEERGLLDASSRPLRVLDLACGSGEASIAVQRWTAARPDRQAPSLAACDPYTHAAFAQRMGTGCERWSFEDVAAGVLDEHPPFDLVLAAFALHLIDKSYFQPTMSALARAAGLLVVATPHKRPHIASADGWEELPPETVHERVRVRAYASLQRAQPEPDEVQRAAERAAAAQAAAESAAAAAFGSGESGGSSSGDSEGGDVSGVDEDALIEELMEEISAMNVGQLRAELGERGLAKGGKKGELAERLLEARVAEMRAGGGEEEEEGEGEGGEEEGEGEEEEGVGEEGGREGEGGVSESLGRDGTRPPQGQAGAGSSRSQAAGRAAAEQARVGEAVTDRATNGASRQAKTARDVAGGQVGDDRQAGRAGADRQTSGGRRRGGGVHAPRDMPRDASMDTSRDASRDASKDASRDASREAAASALVALQLELQAATAKAAELGRAAAAGEALAAEAAARAARLSAVHAAAVAAGVEARQAALDDAFDEAEKAGVPLSVLEQIDARVEAGEMSLEKAIQQVRAVRVA